MKTIDAFCGFEVNKTKLDKVKGGKEVSESHYTGSGPDGTAPDGEGGYYCSQEFIDIYEDDTFSVWFVPCD